MRNVSTLRAIDLNSFELIDLTSFATWDIKSKELVHTLKTAAQKGKDAIREFKHARKVLVAESLKLKDDQESLRKIDKKLLDNHILRKNENVAIVQANELIRLHVIKIEDLESELSKLKASKPRKQTAIEAKALRKVEIDRLLVSYRAKILNTEALMITHGALLDDLVRFRAGLEKQKAALEFRIKTQQRIEAYATEQELDNLNELMMEKWHEQVMLHKSECERIIKAYTHYCNGNSKLITKLLNDKKAARGRENAAKRRLEAAQAAHGQRTVLTNKPLIEGASLDQSNDYKQLGLKRERKSYRYTTI